VLVTPAGVAKLSDLGLAGCVLELDQDSRVGKIVGTPDYLSPEQILNPHNVTKLTDIYSLGCTLYYAVTGKVPFPGGTAGIKAKRILEERPLHPRQFSPDISEEFVEIIADMMEIDPSRRASSAAEVAARLEPWASEVSPILSRQLSRSPWTAPSLPIEDSGSIDSAGMEVEADDAESSRQESVSQGSQGTFPVSSALQDTRSDRAVQRAPSPPPLPIHEGSQSAQRDYLVMALALAIPLALALGVLLGMLLRNWMG
jgi:serine/threonine protein kinase